MLRRMLTSRMDDDGDYFTWTLSEARAVLTDDEAPVAALHYDINEIGEMHHNPAKNVLYVRASIEEMSRRMGLTPERVTELLDSDEGEMYAARLQRPTPYVDKTIYTGWNAYAFRRIWKRQRCFIGRAKSLRVAFARSGSGGRMETSTVCST